MCVCEPGGAEVKRCIERAAVRCVSVCICVVMNLAAWGCSQSVCACACVSVSAHACVPGCIHVGDCVILDICV